MRPGLYSESGAGKSSVEAESRDTSSRVVLQELEVVESAAAAGEASQHVLPATLAFVAVGELHVCVFEGEGLFG